MPREIACTLAEQARRIWQAGVDAVRPDALLRVAIQRNDKTLTIAGTEISLSAPPPLTVVGAGKAGSAMAESIESILGRDLMEKSHLRGWVNVPDSATRSLERITLHGARPPGVNHPTEDGVMGATKIVELVKQTDSEGMVICLLSGGGSALLPAPVPEVGLKAKQQVTELLHACGATINEMNAVRKHLSFLKGGGLAQCAAGRTVICLIISDVVGDPIDVIASGPCSKDPSTFEDAWNVVTKFQLENTIPKSVSNWLHGGMKGNHPETLKHSPVGCHNIVIGNNATALRVAHRTAELAGFNVVNLGPYIEGDTRTVGDQLATVIRSIRDHGWPDPAPTCLLSGGETTVTLGTDHGLGGRNQEMALGIMDALVRAYGGDAPLEEIAILCGGTDGEDGPTDAAGALVTQQTLNQAAALSISWKSYLERHDAYHFLEQTDGLLKTELTDTNVMDMRVVLVR